MITMKYKPILFSPPMVRALLDGRKTQTRRIIKPAPGCMDNDSGIVIAPSLNAWKAEGRWWVCKPPPIRVGDVLWVRETWSRLGDMYVYKSSGQFPGDRWRSPIHMPRAAARIFLEVVDVRAQRVQEIGEEDAKAEGAPAQPIDSAPGEKYRNDFAYLWDSIHGPGAWALNSWVWAYAFKPATKPEDWALRPVGDLDGGAKEKCSECGVYPPDHKGVCEGCLAYREHQA